MVCAKPIYPITGLDVRAARPNNWTYIKASLEGGLVRFPRSPVPESARRGVCAVVRCCISLNFRGLRKNKMDNKTIYSKTGKGVLEIKNKAGKLPKDLVKVLTLIDGKSTIADLMSRSKLSDADMNKALGDLTKGGYIKEFANTSTGTQSGGAGSYVDDLDFTSSLSPGKNVYQNAQSEWRQRETADRTKAEEETKRKREEEDRLKKEQAAKQAKEEGVRMAKVEAERKAKEAAGHKLREEAERKAKLEADVMSQTQRDLSKILEAERKAFELTERKKLEEQQVKAKEEVERRTREEAERKVKDEEERRRREAEEGKQKEEEERKRREDEQRKRRVDEERKKGEEEERKKREEDDRRRREEEERNRKEDEERKHKEDEERKRREEEERKKREEEERKRKEEEEHKRREEEERKKREEEERKRKEEEERKRREEEEQQKRKEEEERKRKEEEERKRKEEAERKRKEEEERIRAEEERKRKEEEDLRRKEEEERRRREDEEKRARREEEDSRRREEDERRRREDDDEARARGEDPVADRETEQRRKRENEERRLQDEEDIKRRDEEDRRRREDDERREREDADRRRAEGKRREEDERRQEDERREREEADRRREEESRRKREEEERATQAAAAAKSALPEFDLSGLRAMESTVAAEFEKQQEELRKREEEEERHREQEEQARMAMERAEREEQARAEAERREAEDHERRERMERERQDREERERKRQEEKEARVREQEEVKTQREQERQRQDAMKVENERRSREDDLAKRRKDQEERDRKRAEVDALKKQKGIRTPLDRLKPVIIGVVALIAVVIGGVQLVPMNSYVPSIEKLASEHIKEPVSIGSMHVSILGGFTIILQNIKLGTTQDIKIDKVSLSPEFGSVFGDVKIVRKMDVESVTVAEEVLPRLPKWLEAAVADKNLQIGRVVVKSIKLESHTAKVPPFDADLQLSPEGAIEKAVLSSNDGKLNVELVPHDNQIDIALSASKGWVPPVGPQIEFTDLTVKAVAVHNQVRIEKFESLLYGGAAKGSAIIVWGGPWSLDGEVETQRIGMQDLMATFTREAKSTGQLESKLRYSMSSQALATLFDAPKIDGSFDIKKGDLDGVDLVRALQSGGRGVTQGGATRFEEISGTLALVNGRYQYRNMKLSSGLLSATGAFEVSATKEVSGRISVELRSQAAQIKGNFTVDGDLKAVVLKPN
jgi:hypothetical protein